MRKIDENRAQNYIKKHERYQKWLVFALCLSLLTGTATLYMLNKPATAMTEEALDNVGIVIPTADAEFEQELIQLTQENKEKQESGEVPAAVEGENAGNTSGDEIKADEVKDETAGDEAAKDEATSGESSDEENKETELTDEEKAKLEAKAKTEQEAKEAEEKLKNAETAELSENVVLTVSYVDENGDALADEKEISLTDSIDFSSEAREIEGYTFKEASIDGAAITVITAKQDADEHKYYEVTLKSGEVVEIKENKTVVLTYTSNEAKENEAKADADSVKLTARYIDKDGEEIREAQELNITKEIEFNADYEEPIDGYFFDGVFFEENRIVKITPVIEETKSEDESEAETSEEDTEEYSEEEAEPSEVTVTGYDITTVDGEVISVAEDAEISFRYLKACEETEFTFEDSKITVKIVTTRDGVFPEGIELKVAEVTPDTTSYNYDAYLDALNENAETIASEVGKESAVSFSENNTLLYDIAFIFDGKEIQPKEGSVVVTMEFKEQQLTETLSAQSESDVAVVHLPIKEEVKETTEITTTEEAKDISSGDIEVQTLTETSAEVGDAEKVEFTSDSFSIYAVTVYQNVKSGSDTFETVLGDAINFGIVTDRIVLKESQTNIATKNLVASGQFGNDITNNAEQTFIASRISGSFNVKGFPAYFITPSKYINLVNEGKSENVKFDTAYSTSQLDKIVDDMLKYTRDASADLAGRDSIKGALKPDRSDSSKYEIDLTGQGAGTYYINLDNSDMAKISEAEKLRIYKKSDQRIVFNVTATGDVDLYKFGVSNDGGALVYTDSLFNKTGDTVAQSIIWNFINAKKVTTRGSVVGVFISGRTDSTWDHYSTSSGWLAFPNVNVHSGEWHNTYDKIRQISGTAQLEAYKNIDNEEATVSGFKFTLYKKDSTVAGGWKEIETVTNDKLTPHNISFSPITYGNNKTVKAFNYQFTDSDSSFIYKIVETQGYTDENNKSYTPDKTVYYAKVDVTKQSLNETTASTYFRVSAPKYYTDENCKNAYKNEDSNGIPVFNNKTGGSVGFTLHKYLNNQDPGTKKFKFTVKVLHPSKNSWEKRASSGVLETLTDSLENIGSDIPFNWEYTSDYLFENSIFFVVTENDVEDKNIIKDNDVFVIRVVDIGTANERVLYSKFDYEDATDKALIDGIATDANLPNHLWNNMSKAKCHNHYETAFYNKGKTMLRIHKMVVNEFGSKLVRDGDNFNNSILKNVVFRITSQDTGKYVVFKGFVSDNSANARTQKIAREHNADGSLTGNVYEVTYNQKAQWTVTGLPEGNYTVEEVADGFTFGYNEYGNYSSIIESQPLSRVTKYDVTEDEERPDSKDYGAGGSNYRVVFSADLDNHSDDPPINVNVGGAIKTVQVCNYYSAPLGPVQVTKNFFGSAWTSDKTFVFNIEPIGYKAWDTAHHEAGYSSGQPMPENAQVSVTGDGTNTRIVEFGRIPFRYEGEYKYKITEAKGAIPGVLYDDKAIYVKIDVSKKETRMHKKYDSVTNPRDYNDSGAERNDENFFYLGADITYATDESFSEESTLAKCTLSLENDIKSGDIIKEKYKIDYSVNDLSNVAFNNTLTGSLTVNKEWIDIEGKNNPGSHTSLSLNIWQRTVGSKEWKLYTGTSVVLSADNNWSQTVTGLPLQDDSGNAYEYSVKESDDYLATYAVSYTYGSNTYYAEDRSNIKVDGKTVKDTGYVMHTDSTGVNFGNVTITNRAVISNTIPSTGGIGTGQYVAIGALLMAIAFAGMMLFRRRKSF